MPYDVLVIGGGPAGLSAAVNVRIRGRSVLVVSNPQEENPLWRAERVDNYLGLPGRSGPELLTEMRRHAESAGVEFLTGKVLTSVRSGKLWYVSVGTEMYAASALVLAAGVARGKKFPGEAELLGKGVSYCATCDGMLYRGRPVAVLGYSDSARREADFLREIGCSVTYFHRPKECRIEGDTQVKAVVCDGERTAVDGVFLLRPTVAPWRRRRATSGWTAGWPPICRGSLPQGTAQAVRCRWPRQRGRASSPDRARRPGPWRRAVRAGPDPYTC